jgi:predicted ATPase/DNA-binding CsgD family transcriptional regulator
MTTDSLLILGNLPAEPNSFVGRQRDLAELATLLGHVRVVTLCGPGGIGKTRLAIRLAREVQPSYPDGAWLAELGELRDAGLIVPRVASALGIRPERDLELTETLADALQARRLLLILDTCEHLVDVSAGLVQRLLAGAPGLRIIATSREPLRVRGETVWRVPPLELPPASPAQPAAAQPAAIQSAAAQLSSAESATTQSATTPAAATQPAAELSGQESIRLFADRAAAVRPGFRLGPDNAGAVARLCRLLDGVPLAIELAAARVRSLSVAQVADRLDHRFELLATGDRTAPLRQQTLRAAVDWSYELLTEAEQVLLRRLSVFAGWDLEMAEQVCADDTIPAGQVLGLLAALIDKSLVVLDGELGADARYRLLDTIRDYAAEQLTASGERDVVQARHRDYMLGLIEGIAARAFVRGDPPWPVRVALFQRALAEMANCRAALQVSLERRDAEEGLRLCCALRSPWIAYGEVTEGAAWFSRFLALDTPVPAAVRARALILGAEVAFEQQDYGLAEKSARAGLELSRTAGAGFEAGALRVLAVVSLRAGRLDDALGGLDAAVDAARAAGDEWEHGLALSVRASILTRLGRLTEARQAYQEALDVLQDNNGWGVAQARYGFGNLARARGDNAAALAHFGAALELYRAIDARPEIARCLAGIGRVQLAQGQVGPAAASLTESVSLSLATGQRLPVARGLEALAALAVAGGRPERAVCLAGAAATMRAAVGHSASAPARGRLDDLLAAARSRLGEQRVTDLLREGAAMSASQAVRLAAGSAGSAWPAIPPARPSGPAAAGATGKPAHRDGQPPDRGADGNPAMPGPPNPLTAREQEIAALIARGLSNRAIAAALVISPATAARHVANILGKLGFSSRAQVAAWAAGRADRDPAD